jgi:hypothetical protein
MPYFLRIGHDRKAEVCEAKSDTLNVPSHCGKIWLDGDIICLQFPAIEDIRVEGRPPLQIASHMVRFPADEMGITSAEAVVYVRQKMLQEGNEGLLLAFAERGTDHAALMQLYKEILP